MLELLQLGTVIFALVATALPLYLSCFFWNFNGIGRALSFMLLGEAVSNFVALHFAINSYANIYNAMSPWESMGMRAVIFTATVFSTIHLARYLIKKQNV